MRARCTAALFVSLSLVPPGIAEITAVDPFTGEKSENLENVTNQQFLIDESIDVFEGDVTFVSGVNKTTIHLWGGSTFNGDPTSPRSGSYLIGATTIFSIHFNVPVTRFGSYFTNNSGQDDATAIFYDQNGELVGEATIHVPGPDDVGWHWNGWHSPDIPIGRIDIVGNGALSGFIWLDDLELDQNPVFCTADFTQDGNLNILDFIAFQTAFQTQDPVADLDGSGTFDIIDFIVFQSFFETGVGCP